MPVLFTKTLNKNTFYAVWHIIEQKHELIAQIDEILFTQKALHDNLHWLASRALLSLLFKNTHYVFYKDQYNKPHLTVNNKIVNISITHSADYAAIMVSQSMHTGIDLEKIDLRIDRVAKKFLNQIETGYATTPEHKTLIWSAKESLYKLYGKKEVDFKEQLIVYPFNIKKNGSFIGEIEKDEMNITCNVFYLLFNNMVLTYCTV